MATLASPCEKNELSALFQELHALRERKSTFVSAVDESRRIVLLSTERREPSEAQRRLT